jgi:hypothetical protein
VAERERESERAANEQTRDELERQRERVLHSLGRICLAWLAMKSTRDSRKGLGRV